MREPYRIRLLSAVALLIVGVGLTGCSEREEVGDARADIGALTSQGSQDPAPPRTLTGSFEVYYGLHEDVDTGNTPKKMSAIHFYDEYIVIQTEGHGGKLIPIRQIKYFRWD